MRSSKYYGVPVKNWNPDRAKIADTVRNAAEKAYEVREHILQRTIDITMNIANHIDDGNLREARRVYKRNSMRVFVPKRAMKFLFPKEYK